MAADAPQGPRRCDIQPADKWWGRVQMASERPAAPLRPSPPVVLHTRLAAEGPRVPGSAWHESRWRSPCLLPVPNEQSRDTPRLRAPDREPSTSEKCCPPAAQLVLGCSCPISWFLPRRPDLPPPSPLPEHAVARPRDSFAVASRTSRGRASGRRSRDRASGRQPRARPSTPHKKGQGSAGPAQGRGE